jgi:chemotaxis signal transduction protein
MSTDSSLPSTGEPNPDSDAIKNAVEAAFGPGAFALIAGDAEPPSFPQAHEEARSGSAAPATIEPLDTAEALSEQRDQRKYVVFELAGQRLAASIENLREIQLVPRITPVIGVPDWLVGIAHLRGQILSVTDLGMFLGLNGAPGERRLLVAHARFDDLTAGLLVDRVLGLCVAAGEVVSADPVPSCLNVPFVRGLLPQFDLPCAYLDLEGLLLSHEFRDLNPD